MRRTGPSVAVYAAGVVVFVITWHLAARPDGTLQRLGQNGQEVAPWVIDGAVTPLLSRRVEQSAPE